MQSIIATHADERKELTQEHERNRLKYMQIVEETHSNIKSIGADIEAFKFEKIPIR